ncbi:MAG: transketolase C-terminal domain-containing protein [Parcubacteria group bacterium]
MKQCIEGSNAIARTIKLCRPAVISAYPITPQTHIVEDLAKFKADGEADFEFVRSESEFSAASIVLGASATGVRTYTATSSQGLLLMTEVIFTIAGMRLPVVLTCANRAVSAPINIWNDQQDVMVVRDSGWIQLFAKDNQEAVDFHIIAYKIAEQLKIPVMVNVDGFILTHTVEPVDIPTIEDVKKFLPDYMPTPGQYLDVDNPISLGSFATPDTYMEIRKDLAVDLAAAKKTISGELGKFAKTFGRGDGNLVEYYGAKDADVVFVALGSVVGTVMDAVDELNEKNNILFPTHSAGVVSIKCFRPFPEEELLKKLKNAKYIAVLDKNISLGKEGVLATELKSIAHNNLNGKIQSFIIGLGGRDVTKEMIKDIYKKVQKRKNATEFIG